MHFTNKIPQGKVSTYQMLAKAIGRPRAVRAVGNALNKNPLMIKIPCHRVIKSDGKIGGFAAGIESKVKFLCREGVAVDENHKVKDWKKILHNFK